MDGSKQRKITLATLRYFQPPTATSSMHYGGSSLKAEVRTKAPSTFHSGKSRRISPSPSPPHKNIPTEQSHMVAEWILGRWGPSARRVNTISAFSIDTSQMHSITVITSSIVTDPKGWRMSQSLKQQASSRNLLSFPLARGKS